MMEFHRQRTRADKMELDSFIGGEVSGSTVRLQEVIATDLLQGIITWVGTISEDGKKIAYTYWSKVYVRYVRGSEY